MSKDVPKLNPKLFETFCTTIKVDKDCYVELVEPISTTCPACCKKGAPRRGVGFDNETRCGDCNIHWECNKSYFLVYS